MGKNELELEALGVRNPIRDINHFDVVFESLLMISEAVARSYVNPERFLFFGTHFVDIFVPVILSDYIKKHWRFDTTVENTIRVFIFLVYFS